MTKSKLNLLFPFLCLFLSLSFPAACASGVKNGLSISIGSALPALFPSLVLSSLLTGQKSFLQNKRFLLPYVLGLFCGFPVGASTVATLVREGEISAKDGEKLLFFCNNASPAFLISYCGGVILKNPKLGLFLYLMQCALSTLCLFFCFGRRLFSKEPKKQKDRNFIHSKALDFPSALKNGMNSFIYIMSCMIFFSFLSELIRTLFSLNRYAFSVVGSFLELCGGLKLLHHFQPKFLFPLCALACGWGGLSVHLQTAGILEESKIGIKSHVLGKLFFSVTLCAFALFLQKLL